MNGTWTVVPGVSPCGWIHSPGPPLIELSASISTTQLLSVAVGPTFAGYHRTAHWSCQVGIPTWTLTTSTGTGTPPTAVLTL